jgi:hypothetical protein
MMTTLRRTRDMNTAGRVHVKAHGERDSTIRLVG